MKSTDCPDPGRLLRFLEDPSPGADDLAIVAHVEGCAACRTELERLAATTELSGLRVPRTVHDALADLSFLTDLKHLDLRRLSDQPAPQSHAEDPLPAIPGFELLGELGRGGAGVVYHARHLGLRRPVAIKMLNRGLFPTEADRRRLRAEAEAVARLQHPNVVQLYETGEIGGSPYLVLEYVSGGTLESHLAGRPQPPRAAAALAITLARAVHAAHMKQIIHRDLKPANILLERDAESVEGDRRAQPGAWSGPPFAFGVPKIADFGLAKQLDRTVSGLTQTLSGTPAYMSPEQIPERAGEPPAAPVTPATDVYALGVIVYEMLTGRPPFLSTDWVTTLLQVVRRAPVPPRELQPGMPRDLQTICLKCLEKEPGKRYATAEELADDLERFLDHKPIRAPGRAFRPARALGPAQPGPGRVARRPGHDRPLLPSGDPLAMEKGRRPGEIAVHRQCPVRGATPPGGRCPGASRAGQRRSTTTRRRRAPGTLSAEHRCRRGGPATPKQRDRPTGPRGGAARASRLGVAAPGEPARQRPRGHARAHAVLGIIAATAGQSARRASNLPRWTSMHAPSTSGT